MDCDKRMKGRKLEVLRIEGMHAICNTPGNRSGKYETKIRLDRFKPGSTGWMLVQDAPP